MLPWTLLVPFLVDLDTYRTSLSIDNNPITMYAGFSDSAAVKIIMMILLITRAIVNYEDGISTLS